MILFDKHKEYARLFAVCKPTLINVFHDAANNQHFMRGFRFDVPANPKGPSNV